MTQDTILSLVKLSLFVIGICMVMATAACGVQENLQHVTASQIARPAFMVERVNTAGPTPLYTWERMRKRGEAAALYIEGGTESNPVSLHLASRDKTRNLLYLALPCQYGTAASAHCKGGYTQQNSAEALETFNAVLDEVKTRYGLTGYNVVGYDKGANIAALLAASRDDVLSLRTVAGKLNPKNGLSATAIAPQLADIPQHHYIGAADQMVTPDTYHFFRQAMGPSDCVNYTHVQDADHTRGWVQLWPSLLDKPLACKYEALETYVPAPFPPAKDRRLRK